LKTSRLTLFYESKGNCAFNFKTLCIGGSEMSLVGYEPWVGVRQLQDDINRLFSATAAA
jgi:hypothetical protein